MIELPEVPEKNRIIKMLNKTHMPTFANWTTAEQQEMYLALRALAFIYFRTDKILTEI